MRIGYLDCIGGISGDMFVGALLGAGWSEDSLRECVSWLSHEIADLRVERRMQQGLEGFGIRVVPTGSRPSHEDNSAYGSAHDSRHDDHSTCRGGQRAGHHDHGSNHADHCATHYDNGARRGLSEVRDLLNRAPLVSEVREKALQVFGRLAEAEARAHGQPIDRVHFHEVGAVDAIVDVVAVCQGLHDLGVEELYVSPLPLGQGTTESAHGSIPLPAPATAYLLEGVPVRWTGVEGERCTPTGAALVTVLGRWGAPPAMDLLAVGTGAGERWFPDVPNVARLFLGAAVPGAPIPEGSDPRAALGGRPPWGWVQEAPGPAAALSTCPGSWREVVVLATQIDDASPEEIASWTERIGGAGALDVYLVPVVMKKGRPGSLLTVICRQEDESRLQGILLRESSTLGVRRRVEWRRELERRMQEVPTPFGPVKVKMALRGERWVGKPEFESCREVADAAAVAFRDVWRAAVVALEAQAQPPPSAGSAG